MRSVLQPQVKGLADLEPVELVPGEEVELEDVVRRLAGAAYSRVDLVEKRGEFAVRGGIVDVFPPTEEHPLRVEFFGDEVDEIRTFAVADQRTLEPVERLWAPPCRELLLTDEVRAAPPSSARPTRSSREITDKLAEGIAVEGMESLAPVLVDEMELLVELLPRESHVLVLDPERVRTRAHDLVATSEEFLGASWAAAASGGTAPIDLGAASLRGIGEVRDRGARAGSGLVGGQPVRARLPTERRRRARWPPSRPRPTAATSRPWSQTSAPTSPPAARWSPSTRATARRSGWWRCWASTTSPLAWSTRSRPTTADGRSCSSPRAASTTA